MLAPPSTRSGTLPKLHELSVHRLKSSPVIIPPLCVIDLAHFILKALKTAPGCLCSINAQ